MNIAEEMQLVWKQVSIRKEPSFLAVPFSGSELRGESMRVKGGCAQRIRDTHSA